MILEREPVRLMLKVFAVAVGLFFVWEKLQMPYYEGFTYFDLASWLACLQAAVGDAVIVLGILILGRWLFGDWKWPVRYSVPRVLFLLLAGLVAIFTIEISADILNRWNYSEAMPYFTLAGYQIGWVAVAQMVLMPFLSFRVAMSRPM